VDENEQPLTELAGFTVTFTSHALAKSAHGEIKEDGTFRLSSLKADDGAFPGVYKVIVTQPHPNPERRQYRQPIVDPIYEDSEKTPLEATVKREANEFTFPLKRIKSKAGR
jgi:hypothetical protein